MNFKIYDEINDLMNRLKQEILIMKDSPQSKKIPFSEVIIVIDNSNIKEQIEIIKKTWMMMRKLLLQFILPL